MTAAGNIWVKIKANALQIAQLSRFAATFLSGILIVKLGAQKNEVAFYESFLWLSSALSFFWIGGTINAALSMAKPSEAATTFLHAFVWLLVQAIIAGSVAGILYQGRFVFKLLYVCFIIFNAVGFITDYILYVKKYYPALIYYSALCFTLQLLVVVMPFALSGLIHYCIYGLVAFSFIKFSVVVLLIKKFCTVKFSFSIFKEVASLSIPISAAIFVSGSADYIDGFFVKKFFSEEWFALYRYGSRELPISLILANALSASMVVKITEDFQSGLYELKKRAETLAQLLFPLTIILMLCSSILMKMLYSAEYELAANIFRITLLLIIPRLVFPQTVATALRMGKFIFYSALVELALNILLSLILLKIMGVEGIILGTVIAYCADKIFLSVAVKIKTGVTLASYTPLKTIMIYSLLLLIIFIFSYIYL
ncbi:MAG: oligosaccharide flippase family protein [Chitinophagales bacterium]|nr:oligosaccharide flippase family protein [Chitinophagales bacterium]MDW8272685.1 oligosaccharide flippase family protein [Chitinophagales bacterium]